MAIDEPLKPKMRLKEVTSEAMDVVLQPNYSIKKYARSASQMFYLAGVFELENDVERAYCYYTRYAALIIEQLPQHPEYKKYMELHADDQQRMFQTASVALKGAERMKEVLLNIYEMDCLKYLQDKQKKADELRANQQQQKEAATESPSSSCNGSDAVAEDSVIKRTAAAAAATNKAIVVPDRRLKPVYNDHNSEMVTCKYGLRPVLIPKTLVQQFLNAASSNTNRDVETCGVLAGKLIQSHFAVTHVIVPKQSGTANSCLTRCEEEIFAVQDKFNVITLGWIHTHPSQTAFLSSVDLHTHCSYQMMFPESVAIVCAPSQNEIGVFMLTPDIGLKVVSKCKRDGFHSHGQNDHLLFESCPHASLTDCRDGMLVDLR